MADDVEIRGLKKLRARALFMRETVEEALPKAVDEGAKIIEEDAFKRAPRRAEGPTRDEHGAEFITRVERENKDGLAAVAIGPGGDGFWLGIQELGEGPSGRAQPWLRPAMDTKKEAARRRMGEVIRAAIEASLLS